MSTQRQVRNLPCRLTDQEFLDRSRSLASVTEDIATETARQTDQKAQMKATLAGLVAQQSRLASSVMRGEEFRDVEVMLEHDEAALMVRVVRSDTGAEIEARPMRDEELQRVLPGVQR